MARLQITVDDGPLPVRGVLSAILEELGRRRVKSIFFVIGEEIERGRGGLHDILRAGHALGNHSWDHFKNGTSTYSDSEILEQFRRTQDAVRRATGVRMIHWRAPRLDRLVNRETRESRMDRVLMGGRNPLFRLSHCDANADSDDSQKGVSTSGQMLTNIQGDIRQRPGRRMFRLLFHVKATTARALPRVLDGLLRDGHQFEDFSQTQ